MAKVVTCSNYVEEKIKLLNQKEKEVKTPFKLGATIFGVAAGFALVVNLEVFWFFAFLVLVTLGVGFFVSQKYRVEASVYFEGKKGEELFKEYVEKNFDDSYYCFFGVPLGDRDIDCLMVCPKGIFAFEVKHYNGVVTYDESGWKRVKIGHKGGLYEGYVSQPEKQLFSAIYKLKQQTGIKEFVQAVVVFTNSDLLLKIEKEPQFFYVCRINGLKEYVESKENVLSLEEVRRVVDLVEKTYVRNYS